jgi:hypothetical protein
MKKLLVLGAVALLSACGSKVVPSADTTTAPAAMGDASAPAMGDASAPAMAAAGPKPGSYDTVAPDGKKGVTTIMADGTFVDRTVEGKVTAKGKMAMKDGKTCFTDEKGKEDCFTDSTPGADGSFEATGADGKVTKVSPHKKK